MIAALFLFSGLAGSFSAQAQEQYPIMRPDEASRREWYQQWLTNPHKAYIDPEIAASLEWGPKPNLLDKIPYTPAERNQVSCGNCWAWAGTALLEIMHNVEHGTHDRLSIQRVNSCYPGAPNACSGGNLTTLLDFYNGSSAVPWSNANAHFQDTAGTTTLPCGSITTTPSYSGAVNAFEAETIVTTGVSQQTAIANIKNVLNQQKGVEFNFWMGNTADWQAFFSFWQNQNETAIWNPDTACNHWWNPAQAGGHGTVIVGYNDDDPNPDNHYWIVLNSWGASANRPNGLFRLKMNMNYSCTVYDDQADPDNSWWYSKQFETVGTVADGFYDYNSLYMAAKGLTSTNIFFRKRNSGGGWGTWTLLNGTSTHSPAMTSFNSRLYMTVKGVASNKIWLRSMNYAGTWSPWTDTMGEAPAKRPHR